MSFLDDLIQLIDTSIDEDAVNTVHQWWIIASWFNVDIDNDRLLVSQWHYWLSDYSDKIRNETWIKSLKIKYTSVAGYFIELTKSVWSLVPEDFILKQTLTNALRYTTLELKNFESELQHATESLNEKEYNCFIDIRNNVINYFDDLYQLSSKIWYFDFLVSWASCSLLNRYITPEISNSSKVEIVSGRHPVIEKQVWDFISNDLNIWLKNTVHTITWPNMWWKSTFLRQNALIVIMAHMWIDVPAKQTKIWICDRVFSRVWSWDNLFLWQSTFMLEMQEISFILQNATNKSFIIIDEIWRGTSTFDGMSLAWAILKHIHDKIQSKTLFATHYHEIIDYTVELKKAANYSVAVWENEENIVFLRKVVPGGVKKSYWLEVAKIAGISKDVLEQAKVTMIHLEWENKQQQLQIWYQKILKDEPDSINEKLFKNIESRLASTNLDNTSPIQALLIIEELKELLKKSK